jgi:hypothetical protein
MIDRENNTDRLDAEAAGLEDCYPHRGIREETIPARLARLERRVAALEGRRGLLGRLVDLILGRRIAL